MLKFIFKRVLLAIPTLFFIVLLVFLLVHAAPGSPFDGERALSAEALKSLNHQYYLDLPLYKQFIIYLNGLLHGSFGYSYIYKGQSINSLLFPDNMGGFWVTLRLAIYSMAFSVPLGIVFGCYAGLKPNSWFDRLVVITNMIFSAVPTIVTGPVLILLFAVTWNLFPASNWGSGDFAHLFLPVTALVFAYSPTIAFVTRGSIIDVLNSNYIRTAKAKGLSTNKIIFKHAIRPTLVPVVSLLGPMFAGVLVGAIVTEQIFALPGLGLLTTAAATNRDYNMILGITVFGSFLTIIFNILVDIFYFILDPKIKQ